MVRKEVAAKDKALLEETLYVGLEDGVEALYQVAAPREDLLMLPRDIVTYSGLSLLYREVRTAGHRTVSALPTTARRLRCLITGHDNDVFHTENAHAFSGLVIEQGSRRRFPARDHKSSR